MDPFPAQDPMGERPTTIRIIPFGERRLLLHLWHRRRNGEGANKLGHDSGASADWQARGFQLLVFFRDGEWIADVDRASRICKNVASEFSVSFQPLLKQYVLVYTEKGFSEHSNSSVIRISPNLYGPWSDPIQVYRCPEAQRDPRICCYAAKAHPEIAWSPEELILTYVANSCDGDLKVLADASLYRPRFLRVHFFDPGKK